jgi:eukaryotic-like serine/threonine-protein kinase
MARIPEHLGRLTLLRQLGLGRHCQVWEAIDREANRRYAVKVAVPEMAADASLRRLLRHELQVARSLDHPGIIRVESLEKAGGLPHLVMELFPHPNLRRQLAAGAADLAPRLHRIVQQVAEALEHMHGRGWVHRDIKPDNVLAAADGGVKVIDLAIAARPKGFLGRLLGGRVPAQGTTSYIAPEQIRGGPVDPRSDIYSLGCTIFELFAGATPYSGSTTEELLRKHLSAQPPFLEASNPNVTSSLSQLVRQMLAKRPDDRPASMKDVARQVATMKFLKSR